MDKLHVSVDDIVFTFILILVFLTVGISEIGAGGVMVISAVFTGEDTGLRLGTNASKAGFGNWVLVMDM